jgi:hypothetical protein
VWDCVKTGMNWLGEFSANWSLFALGSFLKNRK